MVSEYAFYKGNSTNPLLFDLVLRLRNLEMKADIMLHVIHISGTRMKACGVDGLSRGTILDGAMLGLRLMNFIPLNKSVLERSTTFNEWFGSIDVPCTWMTEMDWFNLKPQPKHLHIWTPPPSVADTCVERIALNIHIRPYTTHCAIVPRLMTTKWRKQISKAADLILEMPAGNFIWDTNQHEPLLFFFYFPLNRNYPWRWKHSDQLGTLAGKMLAMWKENQEFEWSFLRQFLLHTWSVQALPQCVVP